MSVRHFTREFTRALGQPPAEYVVQVRVDAARRLLEAEPVLVTVAATRMGLAMYLAFVVLFPLHWFGQLSADGLILVGHVLMLPAMVIAMLRRREEYLAAH